ncbi:uncharacterized protein LOC126375421 [Pectinophora gossypiella]|uniref:uncharacterized protein LOC126375421 n=1 Tax=Pectinophora gossypiella TaxID=13191 RepID=UPI00214F4F0F|nr:uncharacterized protein LOC126375421 [Pectinophora gossypiella]
MGNNTTSKRRMRPHTGADAMARLLRRSAFRCSPCGPMVCYKYEDCGPPSGKASDGGKRAEEGGAQKKGENEIQLRRIKSRELRGGIMYYSCHCIKRNGLQHDCRRTGCGGEPACLTLPDPVCAPSQLARARGLADPGPLAAHMRAQGGGGAGPSGASSSGPGKRFIVCELKGITPEVAANKSGKCCKCQPATNPAPKQNPNAGQFMGGACMYTPTKAPPKASKCPCASAATAAGATRPMFVFDEQMTKNILQHFDRKELASTNSSGGWRGNKSVAPTKKEEPCTRPGCVHWQPPPPCVWDLPCKADCFEAHPGIQPGRNPLVKGLGAFVAVPSRSGQGQSNKTSHQNQNIKTLTPKCCTGCCAPSDGGASASGGPADGMPVLVMKLC